MSVRPLSSSDLEAALPTLSGWNVEDDALVRTFRFASHPDAIAFIVRLGFIAEEMSHHPEIWNVWANLKLTLRTHDADDRITSRDVDLAQKVNALWEAWG